MHYFTRLQELLRIEKEEDRRSYEQLTAKLSVQDRRGLGFSWYPVAIRDTEIGHGDYLAVELERTTHHDLLHNLRFGMSAALFSNHAPTEDRIEGVISHISGNRLKISLRTDELPDWSRNGKLGIDAVFDDNSYAEMERALKLAPEVAEKKEEGRLIQILTGTRQPSFDRQVPLPFTGKLNEMQQQAVQMILAGNELAIVHGPPGTGKTTTLVQAIRSMIQKDHEKVLVVAPSNAAVDLLSERLSEEGLNVVRVGNPARVSERLMALTLDHKITAHTSAKEIKKLKRQAAEYRDMAHKYKRSFGPAEREQRKALFNEARNLSKSVEQTEQYIIDDVISKAQVITATLVGAAHYTVRSLQYHTVVIDEAGQALEPACWVPVLKGKKVVLAGDHNQLPPTIRSEEAAKGGLATTLMEKLVALHPDAVVLLEEQYRMHEAIMGFSSREFYGNRLQAHFSVAQRLLLEGDAPLQFVDTAGCGYEEVQEGTRLSNPEEAAFVVNQVVRLVDPLKEKYAVTDFPSIALIAPYRHQVMVLKDLVQAQPSLKDLPSLSVNTIDSFQGQERDAVFISLTRSNADSVVGFLSEIRRMNVAMTRARKKLVVVGDSATLGTFPFYADLIEYAQERGGYISAWELM